MVIVCHINTNISGSVFCSELLIIYIVQTLITDQNKII